MDALCVRTSSVRVLSTGAQMVSEQLYTVVCENMGTLAPAITFGVRTFIAFD